MFSEIIPLLALIYPSFSNVSRIPGVQLPPNPQNIQIKITEIIQRANYRLKTGADSKEGGILGYFRTAAILFEGRLNRNHKPSTSNNRHIQQQANKNHMQNTNQKINFITESLNDKKIIDAILAYGEKTFKVHINQISLISPNLVLDYFSKQQKSCESADDSKSASFQRLEQSWSPNQLKIFTWTILSFSYLERKRVTQMVIHLLMQNSSDIALISNLFPQKSLHFIHYNLELLSKERNKQNRREWKEEEIELLTCIIESNQFNRKWSDIAYSLYCRSNYQFFKTSHQCREKWFNHLNPSLSKEKWTIEQDLTLFKLAKEIGTKWARISKEMGENRTEHMIKNRFKSIFKKYESRFQRCTMKKRIENILKDIEGKYQHTAEKEEPLESENGIEIKECSGEAVTPSYSEQRETVQQNPVTFHKICSEVFQPIEYQYSQDKYQLIQSNGFIINLNLANNSEMVLIDYTNLDFDQVLAKTIFSGSVE